MLIFERVFGKIVSGKNSYEKKRIATGDFWATLEKRGSRSDTFLRCIYYPLRKNPISKGTRSNRLLFSSYFDKSRIIALEVSYLSTYEFVGSLEYALIFW
jgi:hypothetical protein